MLGGSSDKLLVTKTNLDINCCEKIVDIREAPLMGVIWNVKNKEIALRKIQKSVVKMMRNVS